MPNHTPKYCWCLDPGHGPLTEGKRSPFITGKTRFFEFEFNRDIVRRLKVMLELAGIEHMITVDPAAKIGDFLEGRVRNANNHYSKLQKIFVSVHSNAGPVKTADDWSDANGIETWFFHGSRLGAKLAQVFQDELIRNTGMRDRGIKSKEEKQFYVLRKTEMVAILTENGFFNNRVEVVSLMDGDVRQAIAQAHFNAIMQVEREGLYTKV